jgi:hypothetical protein
LPLDDYALRPQEIQQGVSTLHKRQKNLAVWSMGSGALLLVSIAFFFFQQDLVYSFFGLQLELQQLHAPVSLNNELTRLNDHSDYFFNLLAWFGWLFLKIVGSFIGAFFVIRILKKIRYFQIRFRSTVLKFVGWVIGFILIWSGLTAWQYEVHNNESKKVQRFVHYDSNIQDSRIAKFLTDNPVEQPVKAYMLAQAALLQKPQDIPTAKAYIAQLVQAENNQPNFEQYGFKPEQLWTMQHQVYGQSLTPLAKSVDVRVQQAETLNQIVQWMNIILGLCLAVMSSLLWLLSYYMKTKLNRIGQRLDS